MLRVKSDLYATKRFRYYLGASISFGVVASLILGAFGLILAAIAIIIAVAMGIRTRPRSHYGLKLKVLPARQLIHVKLYIVDQRIAFAGSANLTYSGMNRNIERIEVKTIPLEVQQEINAFLALWGDDREAVHAVPIKWREKPTFHEIA